MYHFREVLFAALETLVDKLTGSLNDSVHNSLSMVLGKFDILEGQMSGHASATRHLVDTSVAMLKDVMKGVNVATNKVSQSKEEQGCVIATLERVSKELSALQGTEMVQQE